MKKLLIVIFASMVFSQTLSGMSDRCQFDERPVGIGCANLSDALYQVLLGSQDGGFWKGLSNHEIIGQCGILQVTILQRIFEVMMLRKRILFSKHQEVTLPRKANDEDQGAFEARVFQLVIDEARVLHDEIPLDEFDWNTFMGLAGIVEQLRDSIDTSFENEDEFDGRVRRAHCLINCFMNIEEVRNWPSKFDNSVLNNKYFPFGTKVEGDVAILNGLLSELCDLIQLASWTEGDQNRWDELITAFDEIYFQSADDYKSLMRQGPCTDEGWECSGDAWFIIQKGSAEEARREEAAQRLAADQETWAEACWRRGLRDGKKKWRFGRHNDHSKQGKLSDYAQVALGELEGRLAAVKVSSCAPKSATRHKSERFHKNSVNKSKGN